MSPREKFTTDCEVSWSFLLPDFTIPHYKILGSWFKYYSADVIIAAISDVAGFVNRKGSNHFDSDSVGRLVSSTARKLQARQLAEGGSGYTPPFPERA